MPFRYIHINISIMIRYNRNTLSHSRFCQTRKGHPYSTKFTTYSLYASSISFINACFNKTKIVYREKYCLISCNVSRGVGTCLKEVTEIFSLDAYSVCLFIVWLYHSSHYLFVCKQIMLSACETFERQVKFVIIKFLR